MSWIDLSAPERPYPEFIRSQPHKAKRIYSLINSGRHLLEAGRTDEARRHFLQALNVFPQVTPALNNLALIALSEGDIDRALEVVHESLRSDPQDPVAHAVAAQCWQDRESEPFMQSHVNAALHNYLRLVGENDPIEPGYPETALYFVLQALLLAEDDVGLIRLYRAQIVREWVAPELTWFGIAHFNQGDIDEAYRLWSRAAQGGNSAALAYLGVAERVLEQRLLPFRLDYEFVWPEEDDVIPHSAYSLVTAHAINGIYEAPPDEAQALLSYLVENELPGIHHFLQCIFDDEELAPGVRMLAAVHLLWHGEPPTRPRQMYERFVNQPLSDDGRIALHLLGGILLQTPQSDHSGSDPEHLAAARRELQTALAIAERCEEEWAIELLEDLLEEMRTPPEEGDDHL